MLKKNKMVYPFKEIRIDTYSGFFEHPKYEETLKISSNWISYKKSMVPSPMSDLDKELFENNKNVLDDFNYNNGILSLRTKSGKSISDVLNNMTVRFEKFQTETYITIKSNGNEFQITKLGNFSEKQWETMIGVFMLAGTTYGSEIFSAKYNNLDKAKIALQVIKIVSQLS